MRSGNRSDGQEPSFIERARRAQIIDATLQVVAEQGFAGASLARIAKKAGISKSIVLYHFTNKNALLEAAVWQFFTATEAHMSPLLTAESTASGYLRAWITGQISFFAFNRVGFLAMAEIVGGLRRADGTRVFAEIDNDELAYIASILRQGQEEGEFREFDVDEYAALINRIVNGILIDWHEDSSSDLTSHAIVAAEFVLHATRRHP